jgi:subtilisin-like proprotein convertase family protein
MNSIKVSFNEAINPRTLTASDLGLLGPNSRVAITGVSPVAGSGNTIFKIAFATQTTPGTYTLYVGSATKDMAGASVAPYQTQFKLTAAPPAPHVVSATASGPTASSLSTIQVTFDRAIALSSFTPGDVGLLGPTGRIAVTAIHVVANTGDKTFNITFATQTAPGTYTLYVGSNAKDLAGNRVTLYHGTFKIGRATPSATPAAVTTSWTSNTAMRITPGSNSVSLLNVGQSATIATVTVKVNITYPHDSDLVIYLQAPDGTDIMLTDQLGGSSSNFVNTVFSDSASKSIGFSAGPFTGSFQPLVALSHLAGRNSKGTWKLWVENRGSSSGTLKNWSLTITPR